MQELVFIGSGFGIVVGVLVALWSACAFIGASFVRIESMAAVKTMPATATPSPKIAKGIPPAHVASIAAAVASVSASYRIVGVNAPPHISRAWTDQGRFEQHTKWQSPVANPTRVQISKDLTDGRRET